MNNRELIAKVASQLKITQTETMDIAEDFAKAVTNHLVKNNIVHFQGFGTLDVRKKEKRISVNPVSGKRTLIPPKLAIGFKMSNTLKDKINT